MQQLNMCKVAEIPACTSDATHIIIPRKMPTPEERFEVGRQYLVELAGYITNPPNDFDLHANWNHGVVPKDTYMTCVCVQLMGKMVKIEGAGYDYETRTPLDSRWTGWVPLKSITIIRKLG